MKKKLLHAMLAISATSLIASCGGGGGSSSSTTTTTTLQGQFVDAPVAGIEYETSSGIKGVTDENGYFNYKEGDTVTFKVGKIILGDAKADKVVTPSALFADENLDAIKVQEKVQQVVALLLALDSNPNDDKIEIPEKVKESLNKLNEEIHLEKEDLINSEIQVDIDGDGEEENLTEEVKNKEEEAKQHYSESLHSLVKEALKKLNGKKFHIEKHQENGDVSIDCDTCTLSYTGGDSFSFSCESGDTDSPSIVKDTNDGLVYIVEGNGKKDLVISASDEKICLIPYDADPGEYICVVKGESPNQGSCEKDKYGDYSHLTNGTVAIPNLQIDDLTKIRIVPDSHWSDWDGIICDIDENNKWGNSCRLEINENEFQSGTCQIIIFTDSDMDWELEENENQLFYLETSCNNITNMYLDGSRGTLLNNDTDSNNNNDSQDSNTSDNYSGTDINSFEAFLQNANGKKILFTALDYSESNNYYVQEIKSCEISVDLQNKQITLTNCYGDDENETETDTNLIYNESNGIVYVRGLDEPSTVKNPLFILKDSKIACIKENFGNNDSLACMFNIDDPILKQSEQEIKNAITGLWKRYKVRGNNGFYSLAGNGACIRFHSNNTVDYVTQDNTEQLTYEIKSFNMVNYGTISAVIVSTPTEEITLFPLYKDTAGNLLMFNIWWNKNGSYNDADIRLFKPINSCF